MKLADAMTHLRSASDQTHKFWGYYQAVTIGAVGFAWASSMPPRQFIVGLVFAYAMFAILNCRLVVSSQATALQIWQAIQQYTPTPDEVTNTSLISITKFNKPDAPVIVGGLHIALSILAAIAINARA